MFKKINIVGMVAIYLVFASGNFYCAHGASNAKFYKDILKAIAPALVMLLGDSVKAGIAKQQTPEQVIVNVEKENEQNCKCATRLELQTLKGMYLNNPNLFTEALLTYKPPPTQDTLTDINNKILENYQKQLKICKEITDVDPTNTEWLIRLSAVYEELGKFQVELGNKDAALSAYNQALEIRKKLADKPPPTQKTEQQEQGAYYPPRSIDNLVPMTPAPPIQF